jgi:GNAT superfamily N-acetyltransferase
MLTTRLGNNARASVLGHFLALSREDRRLRFGTPTNDHVIESYVAHLDFQHDALFGVHDANPTALVGVAHLGLGPRTGELGVSVLAACRRRGIGSALISRAVLHARRAGLALIFIRCLAENEAVMRIARSFGMCIVAHGPESEALLLLPQAGAVDDPIEAESVASARAAASRAAA